jgi:hypothetical protein
MPRKKAKKTTKGKTVSSRARRPNRSLFSHEWFGVIVPLFLGLGAQFVIPFESTFGVWFGWICFAVALGFSVHLLWKHIAWPRTVKALLACIIAAAFLWLAHRTIEERLQPSFIFVTPAFWIPGDTWDFLINHRGPKTSYSPQILFVDKDRQDYMRHTQPSLSIADINAIQILLSFPDVNPRGHGSIFAHQFRWKLFAPAHAHFDVDITWRDGGSSALNRGAAHL